MTHPVGIRRRGDRLGHREAQQVPVPASSDGSTLSIAEFPAPAGAPVDGPVTGGLVGGIAVSVGGSPNGIVLDGAPVA